MKFPRTTPNWHPSAVYSSFRQKLFSYIAIKTFKAYWPIFIALGILWFPFDWLSHISPVFGKYFHMLFKNAHDHFVGHAILFLTAGLLMLRYLPLLRQRPFWYFLALIIAALIQETIQAIFRGHLPTFNDFNAFKGDAFGGLSAFALCLVKNIKKSN